MVITPGGEEGASGCWPCSRPGCVFISLAGLAECCFHGNFKALLTLLEYTASFKETQKGRKEKGRERKGKEGRKEENVLDSELKQPQRQSQSLRCSVGPGRGHLL